MFHCNLLAFPEKAVNFASVVVGPKAEEDGEDDDDDVAAAAGPDALVATVDSRLLAPALSEGMPPKKSVPRGRLMGTGERGDDCEGVGSCEFGGLIDGCIGRMGREGEGEGKVAAAVAVAATAVGETTSLETAVVGAALMAVPLSVLALLLRRLAGPEKAEKEEESDEGPPVPAAVGTTIDDNVELVVAEVESIDPVKSKELA